MTAKLITTIVIFLGVLDAVTPYFIYQRDTKICRKPNGFFPKPESLCKSYYECRRWIPVEKTCPRNKHFFPEREACVDEELFPCFEEPSRKECLRPNGKFLKSGTKCKIYYQCCNGIPTEKECPFGRLFDPYAEKCEWSDVYTCVEEKTTTTTWPTSASKTFETSKTSLPTTQQQLSTTKMQTTIDFVSSTVQTTPSTLGEIPTTSELKTETVTVTNVETEESSVNPTETEEIKTPLVTTEPETETSSRVTTVEEETTSSRTELETITTSRTTELITEITSQTAELITEITSQTAELITEITSQTAEREIETAEFEKTQSASTKIVAPTTDSFPTEDPTKLTTKPWDESDLECPEPNGYFPHPYDKHKFINCNSGHLSVFDCPSNLVYNHKQRACVYEKS